MAIHTLPRDAFELLEEAFGDKKKADTFARAMETVIKAIDDKAREGITERKEHLKIELKDELRNELVTREIFQKEIQFIGGIIEARFNVVDEKFKAMDEKFKYVDEKFNSLNFKLNIFIAIALIALTFANPAFVELARKIF